jgi:hypothetical protein
MHNILCNLDEERARLAQNFVLDEKGFVHHEPDDFQEK